MIPATVSAETKSNAERTIFGLLQASLPDSWTALHSLGIASHRTKPWAEIDFVLIGPPGVFCIEVKGGRVRREDGEWIFTNARGEETRKHEGPFAQVGGASAALSNFLRRDEVGFRGLMGKGVMFPDIEFALTGPDIDLDIVYDLHDASHNINRFLERITNKAATQHPPIEATLNESRRRQVIDALRGDFDFRPSLQHTAQHVNQNLLSLTTEQYRILDAMGENDRLLIRGAAGTGKTMLAVEEARRASANGRRVLVCCFSRSLADFLSVLLSSHHSVHVESFHRLMARFVHQANFADRLPESGDAYFYEVALPDLCFEALLNIPSFEPFDTLIIDEGQDLMLDRYWDVFDALTVGGISDGQVRVFYDPRQNLFCGRTDAIALRLKNSFPARCELSVNCRNTQPTSISGALVCGQTLGVTAKVDGPESVLEFFLDASDQQRRIRRLLSRLLSESVKPEQIAILSRKQRPGSGVAVFEDCPAPIEDITEGGRASKGHISFCTVAGFKGLESDFILLIDVDNLSDPEQRSILYVAVTRPRVLLAAFLAESVRIDFESNVRQFGSSIVEKVK
jgi:hypothetical protein